MRRLFVFAMVTVALFCASSPVNAATDSFDLTVTHDASTPGHAVVVTVTTPAGATQSGPEIVNLFLRSDLDDQLRPLSGRTGTQVHLDRVDAQTARAVAALPSDGEWVALPFADLSDPTFSPLKAADEFPIVTFTMPWTGTTSRIRAPHSSSSLPLAVGIVVGGALVAAAIVLTAFRLLDRRSPRPDVSPPAPSSTTTD